MTFSVNGIKQEKNEKYTVEILVCVDASLLARKILEQHNILILSLKEFPTDKKTFGDIYFTIAQNFQTIDIVTKFTDIQEACNFFTFVGFDIDSINSFSQPLTKKEIDIIITNGQTDASIKKADVRKHLLEKEDEERKVYQDENLESAKKIISRVFEKVDEALKRSASTISLIDTKKLKMLTEELKKLRMGTNFEKIRETIQDIFKMIEKINDDYYFSIQNPNDTISNESLITPVDVDKELERMENVKILKSLHAHISLKNQDYAAFGSSAIFRKFLQKDFLLKMSDIGGLLYSLYDIAEFILLVVITLLGIYTLANELYLFSTNQFGLAFSLISMGIRASVIFAARYFRNKSVGKLLLIMILAIFMHYLMMRVVTTNFAL
ncbi:MAG: hypothetical protein WC010_02660 [Candidatus Absconditabacterales bacterium]